MNRVLPLVIVAIVTTAASAVPPARVLYTQALAQEQALRARLGADGEMTAALVDVRVVVAAYASVVRQYPASGYSDNALWQPGVLSLDAFTRFGQQDDRESGVRFLRKLARTHPTSSLVSQVPAQLARVGGALDRDSRHPAPGARERTASLALIRDIRRTVLPDAVRVTIEFDAEVPFHDERIGDPARVFLDLPGTRLPAFLIDQTLRFESDADVVRRIRIGRHPNHTTRVVLDATGVTSYSVYPLYSPFRLVIDCVRSGSVPTLAPEEQRSVAGAPRSGRAVSPGPRELPALLARRLAGDWLRALPSVTPRAAAALAGASAPLEPPPTEISSPSPMLPSAVTAASPATPPARNLTGRFSISRQLGLGVSRVVIDAGHGGHDPGAKGKGITEAELVLDVALRLEKLLQTAGVEVILTRRTDDFIPLPERTAIANREGADLFLSIHANASPNAQARGVESYFLNFASNLGAAAVAARENAASGQAMGALPDFVKAIALNNKLDESRDFATDVQRALVERLRTVNKGVRNLGVKQAPFVVLIGAAMPSVLAEISFVTNAPEARLLKGNAYRQRIAEALFNAIRKYQTSLKTVSTVAHQ
jgi:N-acetylmuramoyl-L-alanine amidase